MTWKIVRLLEGRCHCNAFACQGSIPRSITREFDIIHTAIGCNWVRLHFRFFLDLFSCLLTINLSRTNNRSRAGPQTLSKVRQQTLNPHYIPRLFMLSCWLAFHLTTMMQHHQSAHTAWLKILQAKFILESLIFIKHLFHCFALIEKISIMLTY